MASNALDGWANIYYKTQEEDYYSPEKQVGFFVNAYCPSYVCLGKASFQTYSIYMGWQAKWRGKITGIRVDPANAGQAGTNKDTVGFDYIRLSATNY